MHTDAIAAVIKGGAARAGLDPREFAGHSTHRGFATTAARNGAPAGFSFRPATVMLRAYVEGGHPDLGDIRVECRCGAEYHARSGQLVDEPICGLLQVGDALSAHRPRR